MVQKSNQNNKTQSEVEKLVEGHRVDLLITNSMQLTKKTKLNITNTTSPSGIFATETNVFRFQYTQ